jgi:hypothetical protein
MEVKTLKLAMTGHGRWEVFINGQKVYGVTAVKVSAGIDCANEATITVLAESIEVEGEFHADVISKRTDGA